MSRRATPSVPSPPSSSPLLSLSLSLCRSRRRCRRQIIRAPRRAFRPRKRALTASSRLCSREQPVVSSAPNRFLHTFAYLRVPIRAKKHYRPALPLPAKWTITSTRRYYDGHLAPIGGGVRAPPIGCLKS